MTTTETTVQNPVDTLRRAAKLMRANAEAAAGGPWTSSLVWSPNSDATSGIYSDAHATGTPESEVVASGRRGARGFGGIRNPRNARHIVSWQPAPALAVADWLDLEASMAEKRGNSGEGQTFHALTVARAYIEAAAR